MDHSPSASDMQMRFADDASVLRPLMKVEQRVCPSRFYRCVSSQNRDPFLKIKACFRLSRVPDQAQGCWTLMSTQVLLWTLGPEAFLQAAPLLLRITLFCVLM